MAYYSSDLFGDSPPGRPKGDAVAGGTPAASGFSPSQAKAPALIWVGMIIALVVIRVLWEVA